MITARISAHSQFSHALCRFDDLPGSSDRTSAVADANEFDYRNDWTKARQGSNRLHEVFQAYAAGRTKYR